MKHRSRTFLALASTSLLLPAIATAEPADAVGAAMPAISGALEIAVGGASTMTVGDIGGGMADAADLIGPGGAVELQVGYRIRPHLTLGGYGTLQGFSHGSGHASDPDSWGGTAGLELDFHAKPHADVDPWISIGSGVRWLRVDDGGRATLIGAELVRVQLGADFRIDEDLALGPVIGASASFYEARRSAMTSGYEELADKAVNWTLSAGVAVRFDAFGRRTR